MFNYFNPMGQQQNLMGMLKQWSDFQKQMEGKDPQEIVQGMLQSGQMTKEQFEQLAQQANQLQSMFGSK